MNDVMTIFAEKLATLVDTVRIAANGPISAIATALRDAAGRPAVAIGSGGSAIMAEYFARCRSTLGHGVTIVYTPMDFVLSQDDMSDYNVWIFSAGADNPDSTAALTSALNSTKTNVTLLTVNAQGATAIAAAKEDRVRLIVAPVAERKDGFLATHSLVAMATCMLAAAVKVSGRSGPTDVIDRLAAEVHRVLALPGALALEFRPGDTVMVLHDPQCRTLATLIETSLWETAIAPIQRADFRNFAHGRHVMREQCTDSRPLGHPPCCASGPIVVHFYRNVFSHVPSTKVREVSRMLKAIHAQETRVTAEAKASAVVDEPRRQRMGRAADLVDAHATETLAYYAFPDCHWIKIRTNNPLERIMREIRRRTRVVGAFPDGQSCLNLAAARLRHIAGTQWSTRKYMNMAPLHAVQNEAYGAASA